MRKLILAVLLLWPGLAIGQVRAYPSDSITFYTYKRTFTVGEVLTLGATPITLLPARSGYWYYCFAGILTKDTADVYTGTGSTNLVVAYDASTHINAIAHPDSILAVAAMTSRGQVPAFAQLTSDAAADVGGKALIFTTQSGTDPYGGTGSPLTLMLYYTVLPGAKDTMP